MPVKRRRLPAWSRAFSSRDCGGADPACRRSDPADLRKALFFPALAALRCNPTIRANTASLRAAGRPKMVIVGAAMRRLVHLAFGVLKTGRAYDAPLVRP